MSLKRFAALSLPSCAVWAALVGILGYAAGEMMQRILGNASRYEALIALGLAVSVSIYAFIARRRERSLEEPAP
jgi:membrane protein DedA with SNARE-associated domain